MNRRQRRAAKKTATRTAGLSETQTLIKQAVALMQSGAHAQAEALLRKGIETAPDNPHIVHFLGMALYYQGKPADGLPLVARSTELAPDDPTFHSNFGVVAYATGDIGRAVRAYMRSLELQPKNADALTNLAAALNDMDRFAEALVAADEAVSLNPDGRGGHLNRGNALKSLERMEEAIAAYEESIRCDPDYAEAHTMLGHAYDLMGELDLAEKHTRLAVQLSPNLYEAHNNLATVLMRLGKKTEANVHLARSQDILPNPKTLWNMALNLLDMGDFEQGIGLYDFGFAAKTRLPNRQPPMPRWRGEELTGRSLLIWREQGVGDELRFAEWYHHVIGLGARCVIEVKPKLVPLFERSFPQATILPEDFSRDPGRADADFHVPAGALPGLFGLVREEGERYAYLQPDPFRAESWRARLAELGPGPKIGICWRSGLRNARRNFAYAELDDLIPLLELPNTRFVCLQYDDCREELEEFERRTGHRIHRFDDLDQFDDLDETAAMTSALDLVVTAGTAVAQMAGALGVETWRFEARGARAGTPPVRHQWLQPNGVLWYGHWREPWRDVMERMAAGLGERLTERLNERRGETDFGPATEVARAS